MSNFWAIAVGINHYQLLQPLHFAQQDAQSLCECLVSDAGFFPENCFLLTDTSPAVSDVSTDPTQENFSHWLATLEQRILPEDWVWCFFSGYGICVEGKDYLLPIDADPDNVAETGMSARSFFLALKALPTQNILVLLDIDRAQSGSPEKVGIDVANLAREFSITTMLSCRPEQSSHEAPALNHGLFTQTLIEGLRSHQGSTLAGLETFMKARLPELCDHNDRPIQDPVLIVPNPDPLYQVIMPVNWAETPNWTPTTSNPFAVDAPLALSSIESDYFAIEDTTNFEPQPIMGATAIDMPDAFNLESESASTSENLEPEPIPPTIDPNHSSQSTPVPEPSSEVGDQMFWERLLFGGGAFLVVLLLGVLFRNWSALVGGQQTSSGGTAQTQSASPAPDATAPTATASPQSSEQILNEARSLIKPTLASDARRAINRASRIPQTDPLYAEAQQDIDRWSRNILDIAKKRAEQGEFRQAIAAAQLVPNDRGAVSAEAQKSIRQWRQRVR